MKAAGLQFSSAFFYHLKSTAADEHFISTQILLVSSLCAGSMPIRGRSCKKPLDLKVLLAGLPVSRAKSARLQSLKHAKRFIDRTSDIQAVDHRVLQNAFRVDDEQAAKRDVRILDEDVVLACELAGRVRSDRIFPAFAAVLVFRRLEPCTLRVDRVGRNADNLSSNTREFFEAIREMD